MEEPIQQAGKTRALPLIVFSVLFLAFLLSLGLLGSLGAKMSRQLAPLVDASMEIKYNASLFHLWFEEYMQGDRSIDEAEVWSYLDKSAWYANAMLNGGRNHEGTFIPIKDDGLLRSIKKVQQKTEVLRRVGVARLAKAETSQAGSSLDRAFDMAFASLLKQSDEAELYLHRAMDDEMAWYNFISVALIVAFLFFSVLGLFGLVYFDRQRQRDVARQVLWMEQLHHARRMEAIGILVGGVAHDFNNALAGITGNLYLAKEKAGHDPELSEKLANAERLSFRVADTIKQLLTYAQKETVRFSQFSLTRLVKEGVRLVQGSLPAAGSLTLNDSHERLMIQGDESLIQQLIVNLIDNAVDAVATVTHPRINVRLESFQADETFAGRYGKDVFGRYAHLRIEDNGCGIDEADIPHLFEPFFTTKEPDKGTGMGLAMAYGAVQQHGGQIHYEKNGGQGSVFHVYLPLVEQDRYS